MSNAITFILSEKSEKIVIQVKGEMTFRQLKAKFANKSGIPEDKINQTFIFYHEGHRLDLNSNDRIDTILRVSLGDILYVSTNKGNSTESSEKKSMRDCLLLKNNAINNDIERFSNQTKENKQEEISNLLEDMGVVGTLEKDIIENEFKDDPNKFISINQCLNSGDDQFFILGILAKYFEKIGIKPYIEVSDVTSKEGEQGIANALLQFICNGYISKHKYNLDFKFPTIRLQQLIRNNEEKEKFHNYIKMFLTRQLNISSEKIIMRNYLKSKDLYSIIIIFKTDDKITRSTKELLDLFHSQKQSDFKNLIEIKEESMFESIRLNRSMLDSRGNNKSDSCWGYNETRGGENYYPPVGWWRYGLRVFGKYDNGNNNWLSFDNRPGEWCIAYSGLSGMNNEMSKKYENDTDIKHGGKVGMGVLVSPRPEVMEENTEIINVNGTNYKMGLMLRVEPKGIKQPQSNNRVWVVEGTSGEIRPYGILLKKMN